MSALVVDSSSFIDYLAGRPLPELDEALLEGRVYLPPIVVAELFSGATRSVHEQDIRHAIDPLPLCPTPREHWIRVGRLRMSLARKGLTVSTPDAHVAQCSLDLRAQLLTRDRIFSRIARHCGLRLAG
ncbi:MAG: PIN domain-containing protein [Planctomycetes bacterium]|nr:PIN domain-containing protein [Planctomycetota bacterium]